MTLEITLRQTMEPSVVEGDLVSFINDLNIAAAAGKQYIIATEILGGQGSPAAFETRSITRVRELDDENAFLTR